MHLALSFDFLHLTSSHGGIVAMRGGCFIETKILLCSLELIFADQTGFKVHREQPASAM